MRGLLLFIVLSLVGHVLSASHRSYDYIVVGAGTGGSAAAKRLSDPSAENHGHGPSVLVLEAGLNYINSTLTSNFKQGFAITSDPRYGFYFLGQGDAAFGGRRFEYPPARMWGGTSNINGALWVRGNEYDSKVYQQFGGNRWSHTNNVNTWKTLENFQGTTNCPTCHGYNGEIDVIDQTPIPSPVWETFRDSVIAEFPGLTVNPDYNGVTQDGIFRKWQITVQNHSDTYVRESAATAFLQGNVNDNGQGIGHRKLTVISDAFVNKLVFKHGTTRVSHVEYIDASGEVQRVHVKKDVILAAGTIGTPAILLRSGVGPCDELAALGIECVVNSPYVGKNVQEHAIIQLIFETPADLTPTVNAFNNAPGSSGFIFGGFAHSPFAAYYADPALGAPPPDVELNWKVASLYIEEINILNNLDNFNQITNTPRAQPVISLGIYQPKPKCRGYVTLSNKSPTYDPLTYFCFAADTLLNGSSVDIAYYKWSLQTSLKIVENMQAFDAGWKPLYPTPDQINDPTLLDRAVRSGVLSGWHPVGSARMGAFNSAQQGVISGHNLCAHGVDNVRVADNSIYPETPTGNTQAWAYLAGARAAEFALEGECPSK
jgi:choline dehydrogenase